MKPLVRRQYHPGASLSGLANAALDKAFPPVRKHRSFVEWVEEKAANGLTVDGKAFTWDGFEPMKAIYQSISDHPVNDLIKAAQMGATVAELLSIAWRAEEWPGTSHGFYFPTRGDVAELSKLRFRPLLDQLGIGESSAIIQSRGVKTTMAFLAGSSPIYMRYMEGRVSKDSIPLDGITFDEVRLMNDADIEQVEIRIEGSPHKWLVSMSTAGYPDTDIDRRFRAGSMNRWLTTCEHCNYVSCLALEWPKCIHVDQHEPIEAHYACTRCGKPIDPLHGQWVAEHPDRERKSWHLHSMLRRYNTASRLWGIWTKTRNPGEFQRAQLGLPYLDAAAVPISVEQLRKNNVDPELRWMERAKKQDSYLGADKRGGELHVVIQGPHPSKKDEKTLRHVEIVQNEDQWHRLGDLMAIYNVDIAVIDALPEKDAAVQFAKRFPGRVFLSYYDTDPKTAHVARWLDKAKEEVHQKKVGDEAKYKYTVRVARYLAIGWALGLWNDPIRMWTPDPQALRQDVRAFGRIERMSPVDDFGQQLSRLTLFRHLCSVAREIETDEDTGEIKSVRWVNMGLDPHFLHAYTYSCVAASRAGGRPTFMHDETPGLSILEKLMPGPVTPEQSDALANMVAAQTGARLERPQFGTRVCGNCHSYKPLDETKGHCKARGYQVAVAEIPCEQWTTKPTEE